jgi:hypothetical protein
MPLVKLPLDLERYYNILPTSIWIEPDLDRTRIWPDIGTSTWTWTRTDNSCASLPAAGSEPRPGPEPNQTSTRTEIELEPGLAEGFKDTDGMITYIEPERLELEADNYTVTDLEPEPEPRIAVPLYLQLDLNLDQTSIRPQSEPDLDLGQTFRNRTRLG